MVDISEKAFEDAIEETLLSGGPNAPGTRHWLLREGEGSYGTWVPGGYRHRTQEHYSRELCLDPGLLLEFIYATQPKTWDKLKVHYGRDTVSSFIQRAADEVERRGVVDVLRRGLKDRGCRFEMACFRPATTLNPDLQRRYKANQFSVIRQLHYSTRNENSLDMVLFLNGLPLSTVELKNPLTGQDVHDAIRQYRYTRDPREPLFRPGRCVAHFAVDPHEVHFATSLVGAGTRFFPFNKGYAGGKGNPPILDNYATAYLWRQIWSRDSVLNLIARFVHERAANNGAKGKSKSHYYIFPRYHQLDAVRRLIGDARPAGPGHRYLIQHSAGSGKSFTIAWLAHQLSTLHDVHDERVFDSIIVVTDRRVLDRQMQHHVRQFEQTLGVVETIDKSSAQLRAALEAGRPIIVTTLQKFPVIWDQVDKLPGKTFAVIIDEAHSSQGGESADKMRAVLAPKSLDEAEHLDEADPDRETAEDRILAQVKARQQLPNVSLFAFTATPRPETLQLFGQKHEDGTYGPFSLYSMRQAIEEGFILDVLEHYTTYETYWSLVKTTADDPKYARDPATQVLRQYVTLHPHTIEQKVTIIVEHFHQNVAPRINGRAKAMIATSSRLHAVRFRLTLDKYLRERGYPYKALVAFSGQVRDPDTGKVYSEPGMNRSPDGQPVSERQTAETFAQPEYRFLVVANKFQTGFDQPLLYATYVDKRLSGLQAVQTLSRLNRIHPAKDGTFVLDFVNEAETIQAAFQPYYQSTLLERETDPNLLYRLELEVFDLGLCDKSDIERVTDLCLFGEAEQSKLYAALQPVVDRYVAADDEIKTAFRGKLSRYIRLYAFLSQVISFVDLDLVRLYHFARLTLRALPKADKDMPVNIARKVALGSFDIRETFKGKIKLDVENGRLQPLGFTESSKKPDERALLSRIVKELNERFGLDLSSEGGTAYVEQMVSRLAGNPAMQDSVRVNLTDAARLTFNHLAGDFVQESIDVNFQIYKLINDHPAFREVFLDTVWRRVLGRIEAAMAVEPETG